MARTVPKNPTLSAMGLSSACLSVCCVLGCSLDPPHSYLNFRHSKAVGLMPALGDTSEDRLSSEPREEEGATASHVNSHGPGEVSEVRRAPVQEKGGS